MIFNNIKSFPINWENGMKLSSDHFRHLEDSIEDSVRDARSAVMVSMQSYGLLPYSPFVLQNAQGSGNQSVKVVLNACRAILPGGYRVEILPENIQTLKLPSEAPFVEFIPNVGTKYHLYLTVDFHQRISSGIPETRPIRQPYLCHNYQIECIANDKLGSASDMASNRMKIGEWKDGKIVEGYIPPTLTINGFNLLDKWHQFFGNQLENITKIGAHIVNENRKRDIARSEFCIPIVNYIRGSQANYKWVLPQQSPVFFAVYFGDLAGLIEGLIETCDRDFVRNQLQNGQINDLQTNISKLKNSSEIPQEDMANVIANIKKFTDSLISTLRMLMTSEAPVPRSGERQIVAG